MAFSLQTYTAAAVKVDGETIKIGSIHTPVNKSLTGKFHRRTSTVANGANSTIYSDELGGFSFLWLASSETLRVLVTDTASNSFSLPVVGLTTTDTSDTSYGMPLILGDDNTVNSNVRINSVKIFNTSGNTASFTILVGV